MSLINRKKKVEIKKDQPAKDKIVEVVIPEKNTPYPNPLTTEILTDMFTAANEIAREKENEKIKHHGKSKK